MDQDTSISAIFIDIPPEAQDRTLEVKFTGFKNPNYVEMSNMRGAVEIKVLGKSVDRWETRAVTQGSFNTNLSAAKFDSLTLFSTKPWPGEPTYLEIDLSMTNQINRNEIYEV